nr:ShlB/FhaC/HecB family hemolysin secretion/activation protein [Bordetella sp. LUAb4]
MFSFAIPGDRPSNSLVSYFSLGTAWVFGWAIAADAQAQHVHPSRQGGVRNGVEIQRLQDQQTDIERSRFLERPDVITPAQAPVPASRDSTFPQETPCHVISRLEWQDVAPPDWLAESAGTIVGHCVGVLGLQALQKDLLGQLVDRGHVAARVLLPEQTLASGTLALRYFPGVIVDVQSEGMPGWWRTALPSGPGDVLEQGDLDQAVENIRRLIGQADATIDVAPGANPGESTLIMQPGSGKRLHGYVGGDNGGMDAMGKYQLNAGLTLDSPLFLYDQLSASWNSNADMGNDKAGARSSFLGYSIPLGYWSLFANYSKSDYHQTLAGFQEPIEYGGQSKQVEAGLGFVPYRGADYKGNLSAKLYRKWSNNRIDDINIDVQHRDVVGYELGFDHRHYFGQAFLEAGGGIRSTLTGMSKAPGVIIGDPDWNGRTTLLLAKASAYVPFELKDERFAYQAYWHMQHAKTAMTPSDYFVIGHRYAVRGFDGQMTLAGENGWVWRNDLAWNLGASGQQLYAGLDVGRVSGPAASQLPSATLVGAVVGLRGSIAMPYVKANYDLAAGWPLKKPDFLKTAEPTVTASLQFTF